MSSRNSRECDLVSAMIVARIIHPGSKPATLTALAEATARSSLGDEMRLGDIQPAELYEAHDWLLERQTQIENKLARKHLADGLLVLYLRLRIWKKYDRGVLGRRAQALPVAVQLRRPE